MRSTDRIQSIHRFNSDCVPQRFLSILPAGGWRFLLCWIAVMLPLAGTFRVQGATITARSVALTDVATAINAAANGDTVVLPAGTATWTAGITVTKGISIIGAGKDVTVIIDSKSGRDNQRAFSITAKQSQPMFRLSGLTIKGVPGQAGGTKGVVIMTGDAHQFRIDHIKIAGLNESLLLFTGHLWGVVDHCDFNTIGTAQIVMGHATWPAPGASSGAYGHGSWADGPWWGTEKFIFIEDCNFTGSSPYTTDANTGARYVFRHNFCVGMIGGHGTDSGYYRGTRAVEVYNNTSDASQNTGSIRANPIQVRSGAGLFFNNVFKGWDWPGFAQDYRQHDTYAPWGGSDGTNKFDQNDPTVYHSGTVSGPSSGTTVKLPLSGVTANQYKNYVIRNTSLTTPNTFSTITGNTASSGGTSTFTYASAAGYPGKATLAFSSGQHFEIRKVMAGLDAPGRGKGDLLSGNPGTSTPISTVTGTPSWPRQALEGIYFWNNRNTSSTGPLATFNYGGIPAIGGGLYLSVPANYTPYVYPHPLTQGQTQSQIAPPSNLQVMP
jgi:hypothetical protein